MKPPVTNIFNRKVKDKREKRGSNFKIYDFFLQRCKILMSNGLEGWFSLKIDTYTLEEQIGVEGVSRHSLHVCKNLCFTEGGKICKLMTY